MTDFVSRGLETNPDGPALVDATLSWTYRELDARVTDAALRLIALGVGPADVVAAQVRPSLEDAVLIHAVFRARAVLAPLHPSWTEKEVRDACEALRPSLLLDAHSSLLDSVDPAAELPAAPPPDLAAILWTSGTGGHPRGVEITGAALLHSARSTAARLGLTPDDRWYASLQPAHVGGLALLTRAATLGAAVVATGGFDAKALATMIRRGGATHASLVPVMLRALLDADPGLIEPPKLRVLLIGGARAPARLVREALHRGLPVALTYGMTEATSQVTTAPPQEVRDHPGSVGRALDGVEVSISSDSEILVRGPTLARGYRGADAPMLDPDGWYHSGDLGSLDPEGRLTVTGRRSARIVTGGVTVDPDEVAGVLNDFDGVDQCAVLGLADPVWGEVVAAVLVSDANVTLDIEAIREHQEARLTSAKRVRRFRVVRSLPLNANGKLDLSRLRDLFEKPVQWQGGDLP